MEERRGSYYNNFDKFINTFLGNRNKLLVIGKNEKDDTSCEKR